MHIELYLFSVEAIVFTRDLQDIKITEGNKTVTLECELSHENLIVDWFLNRKQIRRDNHRDIKVDGKIHKLLIENADVDDIGDYSAEYKDCETKCKLEIQGKFIIVLC